MIQKIYKIMLLTITADNTIVNWAALVKNMLFNSGFGYAWIKQGVANRSFFIFYLNGDHMINTSNIGLFR